MKILSLLPLLAVGSLVLCSPLAAQTLSVTSLTPAGNQLTITVRNTGTATSFQLQGSATMTASSWGPVTATFAPVAGQPGFFRTTINRPAAGRFFYRVIGLSGTAEDPDGDGLASAFEIATTNTNPNLSDSDGDGFDDGTEFALGTNPNLSSRRPSQGSLAAVEFDTPLSEATEGGAAHTIRIVSAPPFTGTIHYSINPRSIASAPSDFQALSGTVSMVNGVAILSITLTDDLIIKPDRLVFIDIDKNPPGNAYRPAGATTHVLRLCDNDKYWSGALLSNFGGRPIRMRILKNSTSTQMAFVSGSSNGLPRTEAAGTNAQSTGVIPITNLANQPQEVWPASSAVFTPGSLFSANVSNLRVIESTIIDNEPLKRSLQLTAQTSNSSHRITDALVLGQYTEAVTHATNPAVTFLDRTVTGSFVLRPDLPADPVLESAFAPN